MLDAGIGAGATVASSAFNVFSQHETNKMARNMANTSHFREVRDLRRAGLNPILSANKGAVTPPMNAPDVDAAAIGNSAFKMASLKPELALMQAQAQNQIAGSQASSAAAEGTRIQNDYDRAANVSRLEVLKNEVKGSSLSNEAKVKQMAEIDASIARIRAETTRTQWSAKNEEASFKYGKGKEYVKPLQTIKESVWNPLKKWWTKPGKKKSGATGKW